MKGIPGKYDYASFVIMKTKKIIIDLDDLQLATALAPALFQGNIY